MRQKETETSYRIETEKAVYLVTMKRLSNTNYGCPRFEARLTKVTDKQQEVIHLEGAYLTTVYTFNGHYNNEAGEALFIAQEHEKKILNKKEV